MTRLDIVVDYAKPEDFAAKLKMAAALNPNGFMMESKLASMVAHRLNRADEAVRDLAELRASRAAALASVDDALRLHGETKAMCPKGQAMALRALHHLYVSLAFSALALGMLVAAIIVVMK